MNLFEEMNSIGEDYISIHYKWEGTSNRGISDSISKELYFGELFTCYNIGVDFNRAGQSF